ncbi:hypothetical protein GPECTOR_14g40 [Gonium pectorale]|uniref:Uncharacterized protein n=1 Tax=Gonium pectorale TaxID=33097 RepID=A0A150GMN0_GONPE|nr:hypothetical protein GPECTOR_14g40 [Gonium pectorale]|eukprot:KXZ51054.1 hypothetical protein GPECTOR_14g40 [Gonium pectorale]
MSLLDYLKQTGDILGGPRLVGRAIRVLWWDEADDNGRYDPKWFLAEIRKYDAKSGKHSIKYKVVDLAEPQEQIFLALTLHHMSRYDPEALDCARPAQPWALASSNNHSA